MPRVVGWLAGGGIAAVGCVAAPPAHRMPPVAAVRVVEPAVARAAYQEPATPAADGPVQVDELVQLAVARNPRLAKATFAIDAARGKYVQAGLYPNPTLAAVFDELGDRTGPLGVNTLPQVNQEIVTGRKLTLAQAVAAREADQATLDLLRERYAVVGAVRAAFYDLYALERRIVVLGDLVAVAGEAVRTGETLRVNKQAARLDVVQLEVELARFRSQLEAAKRELPDARRRLAAVVGDPRLPVGPAAGPFEEVPLYDPDRTREAVLAAHPDVLSARVGVERAKAAVRRAEAEPTPNLTVSTGYVRQNQNKSNDWMVGLSAPIPVWNRNQGNIRAARAELGAATQEVGRVENDLAERTATALRAYAAAAELAGRYKTDLLPKAEETYRLSVEAFKGGQFDNSLRVFQAQRVAAEARLEYVRAVGDAWRAAAELSALLLEEWWPGRPPDAPR